MKQFTEQKIDLIIKLKWGKMVSSANNRAYVSNKVLGQLF